MVWDWNGVLVWCFLSEGLFDRLYFGFSLGVLVGFGGSRVLLSFLVIFTGRWRILLFRLFLIRFLSWLFDCSQIWMIEFVCVSLDLLILSKKNIAGMWCNTVEIWLLFYLIFRRNCLDFKICNLCAGFWNSGELLVIVCVLLETTTAEIIDKRVRCRSWLLWILIVFSLYFMSCWEGLVFSD